MTYEHTGMDGAPWFPNHSAQITVTVGYLLLLPLMTVMLASRFPLIETFRSIFRWKMPYSKVTILIALFASWCYIFVGGILNLGVGLSQSLTECSRGLFLCTWFYTTTKLGLYLFLMERAFIVRGGGVRLQSWHYRFNFFLMACWLAVFVLLEKGRIYAFNAEEVCTFGWEWWALIPLMALDVFVNFYLLGMFVVPLFRNQFVNRKLRGLAVRSMWTAVGSVVATISNLIMLIMIDAPGWLCLSSCGVDIFANAALLFYMTRTLRKDDGEAKATWTLAQYNQPDSGGNSQHSGTHNRSVQNTDIAIDMYGGPRAKIGTMTTVCEAKTSSRKTSIADNDSQTLIITPPSGIHVSREVELDSRLIV